MERLIEAEALKKTIVSLYGPQATPDGIIKSGVLEALILLENAPAVDAEPVRHAKWEDRTFFNGDTYDHDLFCSVCNHNYGSPDYEYCPYCGAKMDAESGDS